MAALSCNKDVMAGRFAREFGACSPKKCLKNDAIWCVLVYILIRFCLKQFQKWSFFYMITIDAF